MKKYLYRLPFFIKKMWAKFLLFTAKNMLYMFTGFGDNLPNDIVLYNLITKMIEELELWIKTDGRPTTSNVNYHINK